MKDVHLEHQQLLKHTKTIYFSIFFEDFFFCFFIQKRKEDEKEKIKLDKKIFFHRRDEFLLSFKF